jgi:hypothetical protein
MASRRNGLVLDHRGANQSRGAQTAKFRSAWTASLLLVDRDA